MKATKLSKFGAAFLAIGLLFAFTGPAIDMLGIDQFSNQRLPSPDGRFMLEYFEKMDSQLGDSSSSINIIAWPTERSKFWSSEVIFRGHCKNPGEASSYGSSIRNISIAWVNDSQINITCPVFYKIRAKRDLVLGLRATYNRTID